MFEGYGGKGPLQPHRTSRRNASVRTLSFVEARVVHYNDFRNALNAHPSVLKSVTNLSRLRAKRHVGQVSLLIAHSMNSTVY
jgi:hypothetical protein